MTTSEVSSILAHKKGGGGIDIENFLGPEMTTSEMDVARIKIITSSAI